MNYIDRWLLNKKCLSKGKSFNLSIRNTKQQCKIRHQTPTKFIKYHHFPTNFLITLHFIISYLLKMFITISNIHKSRSPISTQERTTILVTHHYHLIFFIDKSLNLFMIITKPNFSTFSTDRCRHFAKLNRTLIISINSNTSILLSNTKLEAGLISRAHTNI